MESIAITISVITMLLLGFVLVTIRQRFELERKQIETLQKDLSGQIDAIRHELLKQITQEDTRSLKKLLKKKGDEKEPTGLEEASGEGASPTDFQPVLNEIDSILANVTARMIDETKDGAQEIRQAMQLIEKRLLEMSVTDKFINLIEDPKEKRQAIVSVIRGMKDEQIAARIALSFPSREANSLLQDIADSGEGTEAVGFALIGVGRSHQAKGEIEEAETFYRKALKTLEDCGVEETSELAELINALAEISETKSELSDSAELLERYIKIVSSIHGGDSIETAESMVRLGDIYTNEEKYNKAFPLYSKALDATRLNRGRDHEQYETILKKLADINEHLDNKADVAKILEQLSQIQEGEELRSTLLKLREIYDDETELHRLESVYRRLIEYCQNLKDKDPLSKSDYMKSLAEILRKQDKSVESITIYREVLEDVESFLGPEHEDVITLIDELSDILIEQDHLKVAAPLVMRTFKNSLQDTESDKFRRLLGRVKLVAERLIVEKEYDVAEDMYQQALTSMEKLKDPPKKAIIGLLRKAGALCAQIEDYEKSEAAMKRALRITELLFGDDHPETLTMLMQLGHLLQKKGDFEETEDIYKRVLEMRYKILGNEHSDIIESLVELAKLSKLQGNTTESEIYEESAIDMVRSLLGEDSEEIDEITRVIAEVQVDSRVAQPAEP